MSYHCEVKEQAAQITLSIRTRTAVQDLPRVLGEGYGQIAQYLDELAEQPAGPPFAAYYNTDMADLDVELGFPVGRKLAGRAEIKASRLPGGRVASCLYTGPYSAIEPAHTGLAKWVAENGYEVTGICYEFYLNDPGETPPAELQTEPPYSPGKVTGVFACRAEYRPNPIGMTVCKLVAVDEEQGRVQVADIDAYDGTPVIDLKAYFPVCDRVREARIPGWLVDWPEWMPDEGLGLYD